MDGYDALAARYDGYFSRPVDRWEDSRLTGLLRPVVDGRRVLDLGCGTGWLLDHCRPADYTGVDASAGMLEVLESKHPRAQTVKADVGQPGWTGMLRARRTYDVVVATWAFQYLYRGGVPGLRELLLDCQAITTPGGFIALHGYLPRYRRRRHYIGWPQMVPPVTSPATADVATDGTKGLLHGPVLYGCGALPDWAAHSQWLWNAALPVPARWHYSGLWVWARLWAAGVISGWTCSTRRSSG